MSARATITVDDHLSSAPAAVRPILVAARATIRDAAPSASEIAYQSRPPASATAMWKLARYSLNGEEVVGLGTFTKHSTIYFYRGRELADAAGLLQGGGKDMRFVALEKAADATSPDVKQLVRDAFRLGAQAAAR